MMDRVVAVVGESLTPEGVRYNGGRLVGTRGGCCGGDLVELGRRGLVGRTLRSLLDYGC